MMALTDVLPPLRFGGMPPPENPASERNPGRRPPPFRPRFSIGIFYLILFFFVFSFLQVLPELLALLEMPPGAEQEQAALEAARESSSPLTALLLSLAATSLGSYYQVLPGMKVG